MLYLAMLYTRRKRWFGIEVSKASQHLYPSNAVCLRFYRVTRPQLLSYISVT